MFLIGDFIELTIYINFRYSNGEKNLAQCLLPYFTGRVLFIAVKFLFMNDVNIIKISHVPL